MSKVYIFNITSDTLKTDGRPEISNLKLHELICDRQIEGANVEKQVISILTQDDYNNVIKYGYFAISDHVDSVFYEHGYENGAIIPIGKPVHN